MGRAKCQTFGLRVYRRNPIGGIQLRRLCYNQSYYSSPHPLPSPFVLPNLFGLGLSRAATVLGEQQISEFQAEGASYVASGPISVETCWLKASTAHFSKFPTTVSLLPKFGPRACLFPICHSLMAVSRSPWKSGAATCPLFFQEFSAPRNHSGGPLPRVNTNDFISLPGVTYPSFFKFPWRADGGRRAVHWA